MIQQENKIDSYLQLEATAFITPKLCTAVSLLCSICCSKLSSHSVSYVETLLYECEKADPTRATVIVSLTAILKAARVFF